MDDTDVQLLHAIHKVEKKVIGLETKIDDSVHGRFKDLERRTGNLEGNQSKLMWVVILAVVGQVLSLVIK